MPNMKNIHMTIGNVGEENLDMSPPDFSLPSPTSLSIKPNIYVKRQMVFTFIEYIYRSLRYYRDILN